MADRVRLEPAGEATGVLPRAVWRLILDGEADGPTNMATDEAILAGMLAGASPPTLRFYAWSPPCLSLGRSQPLSDVDLAACQASGVQVVRRATGGRAILHTDELTYSVTLSQNDPRADGGVLESYRRLSTGLVAGLDRLGVRAVQAVGQRKATGDLTAICFDTPSDYEITVGGRKLIGSAQWRARGGVLQHGTLPLYGDITRIVACLALSEAEREVQRTALRAGATTLAQAVGYAVSFADAAQALTAGLAQALNLDLVAGELLPFERSLAQELRQERYAAPDWTARS